LLCEVHEMKQATPPVALFAQEMRTESLLMRELQHRMANTLSVLQAHCRLEFADVADPELRAGMLRHERRIHGLAELHQFFSRGAGAGQIVAADYFQPLCAVLCRVILTPLEIHCEASIGEGTLDATRCEWLGLIIAELVTNAAKHGFRDGGTGCVRIELTARDEFAWCCTVTDNGCGMLNTKAGAGSQILETLAQMLEGQMTIVTGSLGTSVTILFPAPTSAVSV